MFGSPFYSNLVLMFYLFFSFAFAYKTRLLSLGFCIALSSAPHISITSTLCISLDFFSFSYLDVSVH